MRSREDETYISLVNNQPVMTAESILFEIATSLGRIADMLAEMNGYIVEYDEKEKAHEAEQQKRDEMDAPQPYKENWWGRLTESERRQYYKEYCYYMELEWDSSKCLSYEEWCAESEENGMPCGFEYDL